MRKLAWIAAGFCCALLAAVYLLSGTWRLWAACACAALALCALLLRKNLSLRPTLALFAAAVGFLWCWGYTQLFVLPAEDWVGREETVTVLLTDCPRAGDGYVRAEGVAAGPGMPFGKLLLYDRTGTLASCRPGDLAAVPLRFTSPTQRYREDSDYFLSLGVHYRAELTGACESTGRWGCAFLYLPRELAQRIKDAALAAFPDAAGPLMKALLTGDKTELYSDEALYSAMRSAGFLHVVAVSGMHVAFLVSLIQLLAGKRRSAVVGIPLLLVFMAMMGFTPSVVRAGLMQIILLLAPLLRREPDPPTSLSFALLVLLAVNPYAAASRSLQLSFAAVAGLQLLTPRLYRAMVLDGEGKLRLPKGPMGRAADWLLSTLAASVGAQVFTLPLTALYSGFVPLYSVLTNLLCLWAAAAAFLLGYAVCLLGLLWQPLGLALGALVGLLPRYMIFVVGLIARLPMAVLVTKGNLGAWWLLFVYLLFALSYALRGGKPYRPVIPICLCVWTLLLISVLARPQLSGSLELSAVDVGQGLSVTALTQNGTVVIDCGNIVSADNAGDLTANFLLGRGREQVDLLILTHFHADHANGVRRLMGRMPVRKVVVAPECEHTDYYTDVLDACEAQGTEVFFLTADTLFRVEDLELMLLAPPAEGSVNERCLIVYGDYGDFEFLVTGDAGSSAERALTQNYDLGDMELLVVGHHGSKSSTCDELLDDITPEYALISCGLRNTYGHPAGEVLERLDARDIQVLRTDLDGTISIRVGSEDGEETNGWI